MSTEIATLDRVLPHNLEAERSVLGAILLKNENFPRAADCVDADDFFRDAHRRVFNAMAGLHGRSDAIDLVTLKESLRRSGELEQVGGPLYISSLVDGVPRATNVPFYASIVQQKARLRSLATTSLALAQAAYDENDEQVDTLVACLERDHARVYGDAAVDDAALAYDDLAILDLPTRDELWAGRMPAGALVGVIGAPGAGKTLLQDSLSVSAALAIPCMGAETAPGGTLVIPFEGLGGIKRRLIANKDHLGIPAEQALGLHFWREDFIVTDRRSVDRVVRFLERHPVIRKVQVETWSRLLGRAGLDENSPSDVGVAVTAAERIQALGLSVVVSHHLALAADRERGSGALRGAVDTLIKVAIEPGTDNRRVVTCEKSRDLVPFKPFRFRLHPVHDSVVPVLVDEYPEVPADPKDAGLLKRAQKLVAKDPTASATHIAKALGGNYKTAWAAAKTAKGPGS